jgi:hypothetical protein
MLASDLRLRVKARDPRAFLNSEKTNMTQQNQNACECEKAACCAAAEPERCTCGTSCTCEKCRCAAGCKGKK